MNKIFIGLPCNIQITSKCMKNKSKSTKVLNPMNLFSSQKTCAIYLESCKSTCSLNHWSKVKAQQLCSLQNLSVKHAKKLLQLYQVKQFPTVGHRKVKYRQTENSYLLHSTRQLTYALSRILNNRNSTTIAKSQPYNLKRLKQSTKFW